METPAWVYKDYFSSHHTTIHLPLLFYPSTNYHSNFPRQIITMFPLTAALLLAAALQILPVGASIMCSPNPDKTKCALGYSLSGEGGGGATYWVFDSECNVISDVGGHHWSESDRKIPFGPPDQQCAVEVTTSADPFEGTKWQFQSEIPLAPTRYTSADTVGGVGMCEGDIPEGAKLGFQCLGFEFACQPGWIIGPNNQLSCVNPS